MDLKSLIRTIPDFPEEGILFRDITTLLKEPEGLYRQWSSCGILLRICRMM